MSRLIDADALKATLIPLWNCQDDQDFANKTIWNAIEDAPTVPRWIPCSERLPEKYGEYLVTMVDKKRPYKPFINIVEGEENYVWDNEKKRFGFEWLPEEAYENDAIIAWMELPEPYKEGQE